MEPDPRRRDEPQFYTVDEVADMLGCCGNTVIAAIKRYERGEPDGIPGRKVMRLYRIHKPTFDAWAAGRQEPPGQRPPRPSDW
jgi:hypothetical protein